MTGSLDAVRAMLAEHDAPRCQKPGHTAKTLIADGQTVPFGAYEWMCARHAGHDGECSPNRRVLMGHAPLRVVIAEADCLLAVVAGLRYENERLRHDVRWRKRRPDSVITFTIEGPPTPWQRPGKGRHGHSYEEPAMVAAKAEIVRVARHAAQGRTFPVGPVRMDVTAVYPRPTRRPAWCPASWWSTGARVPAVTTKDRDNVGKLIADALGTKQDRSGGWKLWSDDNQIAAGDTSQWYAAVGEMAHVEVTVSGLIP